jgi:hypothetical protein
MHATKETKEAVYKSHVKVSSDMYATKETESHDDQIRPHIRPSATMGSCLSGYLNTCSSLNKKRRAH